MPGFWTHCLKTKRRALVLLALSRYQSCQCTEKLGTGMIYLKPYRNVRIQPNLFANFERENEKSRVCNLFVQKNDNPYGFAPNPYAKTRTSTVKRQRQPVRPRYTGEANSDGPRPNPGYSFMACSL